MQGVTTYHGENITAVDTDLANKFMKAREMEGWNTRLFKVVAPDGSFSLIIKVASSHRMFLVLKTRIYLT